jgi:ribonuclease PH
MSFQLLPHPHADGSATVSQGLTSVQVAIYGPREPKSRSSSHPERAVISVEVGVVPWAQSGGAKKSRGDRYVVFNLEKRSDEIAVYKRLELVYDRHSSLSS